MSRYLLDARTATNHFPGIGRYVFNLARAIIPQLNRDEQLILLHNPAQPSAFNLSSLTGPQVQVVDAPVSPFALKQQWLIPQRLRQLKADVYHSPYYLMPYYPGVPTLVTLHDLIPFLYPAYYSLTQRIIFNLTVRLATRTARQIIAVSQATASDIYRQLKLPAAKVTVIPEAADPNFYLQPPETVAALRVQLNLPEQYILYVGSNKPHKNLVRLIEAWAIVNTLTGRAEGPLWAGRKSKIVNRKLVIAGLWDARYPQAKEQAVALGLSDNVQFIGPVAEVDLPALYSGAITFVFPSEYEGFGLPVLEAMACGTPVLCSNAASLPEVAGEAALAVDPLNVEAMAAALYRLVTDADLQANLPQRGLEQTAQFTWSQVAQKTLTLYRAIL